MHISMMLVFWSLVSLVRNSVVLAVYLLFSVACFFTVHEHLPQADSETISKQASIRLNSRFIPFLPFFCRNCQGQFLNHFQHFRRNTSYYRHCRNILCHNCSSRNHCPIADCHSRQYGCIRTNPYMISYFYGSIVILSVFFWVQVMVDSCQHHIMPNQCAVPYLYSPPDPENGSRN